MVCGKEWPRDVKIMMLVRTSSRLDVYITHIQSTAKVKLGPRHRS